MESLVSALALSVPSPASSVPASSTCPRNPESNQEDVSLPANGSSANSESLNSRRNHITGVLVWQSFETEGCRTSMLPNINKKHPYAIAPHSPPACCLSCSPVCCPAALQRQTVTLLAFKPGPAAPPRPSNFSSAELSNPSCPAPPVTPRAGLPCRSRLPRRARPPTPHPMRAAWCMARDASGSPSSSVPRRRTTGLNPAVVSHAVCPRFLNLLLTHLHTHSSPRLSHAHSPSFHSLVSRLSSAAPHSDSEPVP
jgi:hypothetical protein